MIYVANTSVLNHLTGQEVKVTHREKRGDFWGFEARFPDGFVRFVYPEEVAPKTWRGERVRVLSAHRGSVQIQFKDGTKQNVLRKELKP